jgi:transposase InsO family protein
VLCAAANNTYIRTWEGWLYLATVIDLCTKEVIGWSMARPYAHLVDL